MQKGFFDKVANGNPGRVLSGGQQKHSGLVTFRDFGWYVVFALEGHDKLFRRRRQSYLFYCSSTLSNRFQDIENR